MAIGNRITSLLIVLLLTATSVDAQHRWNGKEKHWYKDWLWWVGEGVIVGAFIVDAHSTVLARDSCPGCRETNLLLGSRPGTRALIIHSGLFFALESALHVGSWQVCPDPN